MLHGTLTRTLSLALSTALVGAIEIFETPEGVRGDDLRSELFLIGRKTFLSSGLEVAEYFVNEAHS